LQTVTKQGTQNPKAYELYVKGRYHWNRRTDADIRTAISLFNQAISKDPGYALAYAGLADAYTVWPNYGGDPSDTVPKSEAAVRKALELDPTLAGPYALLASNKMELKWDFSGGDADFRKAFELDPSNATAHQWFAEAISAIGGREQEALAEITRARQLDPLSPIVNSAFCSVQISARDFDGAIETCKKVAIDFPEFGRAHTFLGVGYWGKRMYPQAIEEFKTAGRLSGDKNEQEFAAALEDGFRASGWKGASNKAAEVLKAQRKRAYVPPSRIAEFYAEMGDKEHAFEWLNIGLQEHGADMLALKTDFSLDPIRSDPRFAELVRKVGLPQ
jgi:tetratricopeptide (TPR) repeat protein